MQICIWAFKGIKALLFQDQRILEEIDYIELDLCRVQMNYLEPQILELDEPVFFSWKAQPRSREGGGDYEIFSTMGLTAAVSDPSGIAGSSRPRKQGQDLQRLQVRRVEPPDWRSSFAECPRRKISWSFERSTVWTTIDPNFGRSWPWSEDLYY